MPGTYDLTVVIACYGDGPHLEANFAEVARVLDASRLRWEAVFVNDCSPDDCEQVIDRILAANPQMALTKISHETNTGRGRAVMDGLRAARGTVAGFLDIDLECHSRYIPDLAAELLTGGADLATVRRLYALRWGVWLRAFLSRGYVFTVNLLFGTKFEDTEAGYKFFRMDRMLPVLDAVEDQGWFWDTEIMLRTLAAGRKISVLPAAFVRRPDKKSTVRIARDVLVYLGALWRFRRGWPALKQRGGGA